MDELSVQPFSLHNQAVNLSNWLLAITDPLGMDFKLLL